MRITILEGISERHLPQLVPLIEQLGYPCDPGDLAERYESLRQSQDGVVFVAIAEDGTICGYIHAETRKSLHHPESMEVVALAVDEKMRGRGIGRRLMAAAEDWARGRECTAVWLRSRIQREGAHAFYERLGYSKTKTSHKFERTLTGADR